MGVIKPKYTIKMPEAAKVKGSKVTWTDKRGNRKTGTLTKAGRVQVETDTWQIRYRDEKGVERRESTKITGRDIALQLLAKRQAEVERISLGIASREEIGRVEKNLESIDKQLEIFANKMYAGGAGDEHIQNTRRLIETILAEARIGKLADITSEKVESWIAEQRRVGKKTPRTINSYLIAVKSFCAWAADSGRLPAHPLKKIKKLNEEIGRKKNRRSLTEDEIQRLLEAVRTRKYRSSQKREQAELVYRVLLGTGLRSTELSLATPAQFDFERNRFAVRAASTKNKRSDILPLRPDIAAAVRAWIEKHEIGPGDRIFTYSKYSIYHSFKKDCAAAGIEMKSEDGRSIDVHSLRRTFGTMLARAGVPLTTTQRLMRHSTPELTARLYIDVEPIDMMQAVAKLPEF